jgi:hypothetical protein
VGGQGCRNYLISVVVMVLIAGVGAAFGRPCDTQFEVLTWLLCRSDCEALCYQGVPSMDSLFL